MAAKGKRLRSNVRRSLGELEAELEKCTAERDEVSWTPKTGQVANREFRP